MFFEGFDQLLPPERREAMRPDPLLPKHLRSEIDELNSWVYETVNNGVYKAGFARSQAAYDDAIVRLFDSLDRLEAHLGDPQHQPYLFGETITEADIRLFTTLVRFDVAYHTLFKCNIKMIRMDYPRLHDWLRRLYWDESPRTAGGAFKSTTDFSAVSSPSSVP
jgi:glutathionyl-hydroquinone reductase